MVCKVYHTFFLYIHGKAWFYLERSTKLWKYMYGIILKSTKLWKYMYGIILKIQDDSIYNLLYVFKFSKDGVDHDRLFHQSIVS